MNRETPSVIPARPKMECLSLAGGALCSCLGRLLASGLRVPSLRLRRKFRRVSRRIRSLRCLRGTLNTTCVDHGFMQVILLKLSRLFSAD